MKKNFKFYAVIWAILLAVWCVIVFLVRSVIPGNLFNYDAQFWITFIFILVAFIGNLVCAHTAFKAENLKKMFLNLPLITVSFSALIAILIAGTILMFIPKCPAWVSIIICIVILAYNIIAVIKAAWAADEVARVDEKITAQTSFIKNLTVETESLIAHAKSDGVKAECKKVYDSVRYSDPMSNEALSLIEAKITVKVDELSTAVDAENIEKAKEIADEIVILISDRNKRCKALK